LKNQTKCSDLITQNLGNHSLKIETERFCIPEEENFLWLLSALFALYITVMVEVKFNGKLSTDKFPLQ